jgi:large subunit ribosomal protein L28
MANVCDYCGKGRMVGNNVSHSKRHTKRVFRPNIRKVRAVVDGAVRKVRICTRCLRTGRVTKPAGHAAPAAPPAQA